MISPFGQSWHRALGADPANFCRSACKAKRPREFIYLRRNYDGRKDGEKVRSPSRCRVSTA